MFKRIFNLAVICLILVLPITVFAGDIPESLMEGNHDGMFIGQLIEHSEEESLLQPLVTLMGEEFIDDIEVSQLEKYTGNSDTPEEGDILVIVMKDNDVMRDWLFKANSSDYKNIELLTIKDETSMTQRYENYIQTGRYQDAWIKLETERQIEAELPANATEEEKQALREKVDSRITGVDTRADIEDVGNVKVPLMQWLLPLVILILLAIIIVIHFIKKSKYLKNHFMNSTEEELVGMPTHEDDEE